MRRALLVVLALLLATPALAYQWTWDQPGMEAQGVTHFWMYYSNTPDDWTCLRRLQILADETHCWDSDGDAKLDRCSDLGELDTYVASLSRTYSFVTVTAVNAAGESLWDRLEPRWSCE